MEAFVKNIDIIIFVFFLVVILFIGLRYGRGIKTIQKYALGDRNFSIGVLISTLIATWVSGSGFTTDVYNAYSKGLYFMIPNIGAVFALLIVSFFVAGKLNKFLGKLSIADAMGSLYGKEVRVITAIVGTIVAIGYVARQIKVSIIIFGYFFDIGIMYAVLFSSFIIILYSAYGGVKSVTFTDVMQFCTFSILIPIITLIIWQSFKNPNPVLNMLNESPNYNISEVLCYKNKHFLNTLTLIIFFSFSFLDAANFQRMSMCKNTIQIKKTFFICAVILFCIKLSSYWIGILLSANNILLKQNEIIPYIIGNYSYAGLNTLLLLGLMSMVMSTADSHINSATVLISYDIKKALNISFLNKIDDVKLCRILSIFIGIFGILLALIIDDLLNLLLLIASFYMPIVTVPFLFHIFGFNSNKKSVLTGMFFGLVTVIIWRLFFMESTGINSVVPGMVSNLIVLTGFHFLIKRNIIGK
jgi:Na+/proline symporter